jgi:hypothetical protein
MAQEIRDSSGLSAVVADHQSDGYSRQSEHVLLSKADVRHPTTDRPSEVLPCALTVVAQAELGTGGLRTWILDNLVPLLLLAVAVLLLWLGGGKGDNAGVMRRVGGVIIALGVIGLAVSGAGVELGTWIAGLFSG